MLLQQIVEQIRSQGIEAVAKGTDVDSVSACVAEKLKTDPLVELVNVEGALAESAQINADVTDERPLLTGLSLLTFILMNHSRSMVMTLVTPEASCSIPVV